MDPAPAQVGGDDEDPEAVKNEAFVEASLLRASKPPNLPTLPNREPEKSLSPSLSKSLPKIGG